MDDMSIFNSLLPEILPHVFKMLPLEDRKSVRLTCHSWYRECNRSIITENEKFVFRPGNEGNSIENMGMCITRCKTLRKTLEFQGLYLDELPPIVWERCGDQIRSLFLHDCFLNDATVSNIIVYCRNMTHFRVHTPYDEYGVQDLRIYSPGQVFCSENTLDDLIARKIERKSLVSLELFLNLFLSREKYQKLFKIYPCVRTFGEGHWSLIGVPHAFDDFDEASLPGPREWVLPPTVENFTSNEKDIYESWNLPDLKFKAFATLIKLDNDQNRKRIHDFFSRQTELKKVQLFVRNDIADKSKRLLLHILKSSPKLRELQFHANFIRFTVAEFENFIAATSQLQSLILEVNILLDDSSPIEVSSISPSIKFTKLKKLHLSGSVDERIISEILNRNRMSLHYLYLKSINNAILFKIFELQTELRTLRTRELNLSNVDLVWAVGTTSNSDGNPSVHSFKSLRNLQHLIIDTMSRDIIDTLLSGFDLPNLRTLKIALPRINWGELALSESELSYELHRSREELRKILDVVSKKSPRLEILILDSNVFRATEYIDYCKRWKYLRFIINLKMIVKEFKDIFIVEMPSPLLRMPYGPQLFDENLDDVKRLFIECPSLHWVTSFPEGSFYFYDRFTNKLRSDAYFNALYHKHNISFYK